MNEKSAFGSQEPVHAMSDIEAQEVFRYRKAAAAEHYKIYDAPDRCWLMAYLVPFVVIVGGYVGWQVAHEWIHRHVCSSGSTYGASLMVLAACAASAFGAASLFRAEYHADRALQPLVSGCITLLLLFVWWKTI